MIDVIYLSPRLTRTTFFPPKKMTRPSLFISSFLPRAPHFPPCSPGGAKLLRSDKIPADILSFIQNIGEVENIDKTRRLFDVRMTILDMVSFLS